MATSVRQTRDAAVALATRGFPVFRLHPNSKKPIKDEHFKQCATSDRDAVYKLWTLPNGESATFNIGIYAEGLLIVDEDNSDGKPGAKELAALGGAPTTFKVRTPRNGYHHYYAAGAERFGQHKPSPAIDIRADGGYVVGPGSWFKGKQYVIEDDVPIAPAPAHIVAAVRLAAVREATAGSIAGELDTQLAVHKARAFLDERQPALEGSGGDQWTYKTCCAVLDFGLSEGMALDLLLDWNERCAPPWEPEALEKKLQNAAQYRKAAIGRDNPGSGMGAIKLPDWAMAARSAGVVPDRKLLEFPSELSLTRLIRAQSEALIKGKLHKGETAAIYGESTAGKTFVAIDAAYHIALGRTWQGRRVTRSPVLYVSLEGELGFQKRMLAAMKEFGDPGHFFARLTIPVSLVKAKNGEQGVSDLAQAAAELSAKAGSQTGLIVIDTLARAIAGDDENAAEAIAHFMENRAGRLARETGAAVLVVHHTNKSGGMRGSTSLPAGLDTIIRVAREEERRTVIAEKVKDGQEGKLFDFKLRIVELGEDYDGELVTSCVVEPTRDAEGDRATDALVLAVVKQQHDAGKPLAVSPKGHRGAAYVISRQPEVASAGVDKAAAQAALERLQRSNLICRTFDKKGVERYHIRPGQELWCFYGTQSDARSAQVRGNLGSVEVPRDLATH